MANLSVHTRYDTLAAMKAATGSEETHVYCVETDQWYRYEADGGAYTPDDLSICITGNAGNTRWLAAGSRVSNSAIRKTFTQADHGFAVGDVLKRTSGSFAKAQADSADNAEVYGIVSSVPDTSTIVITLFGHVSGLTGLTDGTVYFLSDATAGALTDTDPHTATPTSVSKPLLIADSTTSGLFCNMRGLLSS